VNPLRSVGARLSLALLLVVAGALGLVYLVVVPSLEDRLVSAKLSDLSRAAPGLVNQLSRNAFASDAVRSAAASINGRIVLFQPLGPDGLSVFDDSRGDVNSSDVEQDPVALRARRTLERRQGTVRRNGERFAEVALPAPSGQVILLSVSLEGSLEDVELVRRRLLWAGLFALLGSLALGYGGAWMFARRIRRLERAAERIAGGRFDEPVVDSGRDELGELARAFDRMRERLARLDDARREFIANASHELRTPLFSLGGFLELLTDEDLDEETRREFLATMREQVDRLTRLATDLLDLSRLDAGRLRVEREPVDLAEVARTAVEEFHAVAIADGHGLEVDAHEPATVLTDAQRALQIARILVENAILHTPPGTRVQVQAGLTETRGVIAVEDDGPGIAADQQERLFERFYRVDGGRTSGSGLGLAIARELAFAMDGAIELESVAGRTVFRLVLPRDREPGLDRQPAEIPPVPA
jgi:signal transduction histidine kinase